MALGSNHGTTTTGANFIPEVWSKEVQRATESNLVAARLFKRFDRDVMNKGDTIHVPKIAELSASSKSANTEITPAINTEGKVDITIDQHYYIAVLIEDILDTQSAYELGQEYKNKISYGLAKQIDTAILNLQSGLTQSVGTAGTPPTDDDVREAVKLLDDADAPASERVFIMAPKTKSQLLAIDRYVDQDFVGDKPVVTGYFGQRYGLAFYVSTNTTNSSTDPINLIAHKEAYAAAVQKQLKMASQYKAEFLGMLHVGQILYGVAEYRDDHGVKVLG